MLFLLNGLDLYQVSFKHDEEEGKVAFKSPITIIDTCSALVVIAFCNLSNVSVYNCIYSGAPLKKGIYTPKIHNNNSFP